MFPRHLDETSFELILRRLIPEVAAGKPEFCFDFSRVEFVDPFGMVGMLCIGHLLKREGKRTVLVPPRSGDVRAYLERMSFIPLASRVFDEIDEPAGKKLTGVETTSCRRKGVHGVSWMRESDVLLEITAIEKAADVHTIVSRVRRRARRILRKHLGYDDASVDGFVVALSEVCQNIIEHSQTTGYAAIQKYHYAKRLGRNVVKIAVMDLGIGIRKSLEDRMAVAYGSRWSDMVAIEEALLRGTSRYDEPGRGHGLQAVRRFVTKWDGCVAIRSGSAKIAVVPRWLRERSCRANLPAFPGTQVSILLPAVDATLRASFRCNS